ncbi:unnamed protein product [Owenia fusiformis]|uniref:Uncharacterized protein n=1 Tax=Owenia fusiformis TaxID=6347 RepID=A0A8J1XZZ4_OWEFU|nr:unnamed protein product [Owenia fusiformis]
MHTNRIVSSLTLWGTLILLNTVSSKIMQLSPCKADVHGRLINLEPLQGVDGTPRFTSIFNDNVYTFNPCKPYREPPSEEVDYQHIGQCRQVALCREEKIKNGTEDLKVFSTLGSQGNVRFKRAGPQHREIIQLRFKGRGREKQTRSYIILVCAVEKVQLVDAVFKVFQDNGRHDGENEIYGELHHLCACPGGCPEGIVLNDTIPDVNFNGGELEIGPIKDPKVPITKSWNKKSKKHENLTKEKFPIVDEPQNDQPVQHNHPDNDEPHAEWAEEESYVHVKHDLLNDDLSVEEPFVYDDYDGNLEFLAEVKRRRKLDPNFKLHSDHSSEGDWSSSELGDSSDDGSSSSEEDRRPQKARIPDSHALMALMIFLLGLMGAGLLIGTICYCSRNKSLTPHKNTMPGLRSIMSDSVDDVQTQLSNKDFFEYSPKPQEKTSQFPVLSNCVIPKSEFETGQRLGGGLFADTYIGEWKERAVVVKRLTIGIHTYGLSGEDSEWLLNEVKILSKLRHKYIVRMIGVCLESKTPRLVCEHIDGKTVRTILNENGKALLWQHKIKMCQQAVEGVIYLHHSKPSILHRDLRCANLIVDQNERVRVGDFGIVKLTQRLREQCNEGDTCYCQKEYSALPASIRWSAPEIFQFPNTHNPNIITSACDVYSFGMVLWEMCTHMEPFADILNEQQVMDTVKEGVRPPIPNDNSIPSKYKDLMMDCWENEPKRRPTFKKVAVALKEIQSAVNSFQNIKRKRQKSSTFRSSTSVTFASDFADANDVHKSNGSTFYTSQQI